MLLLLNKIVGNSSSYDKVKHLVEVDDHIYAVFVVQSSQIKDLFIAKNSNINNSQIQSIFNKLNIPSNKKDKESKDVSDDDKDGNLLGNLLWDISEYDNLRILKIYENDKIVIVLIKSNIHFHKSVDNILAYYFEIEDEIPKSLF
jgi:hypothetical protein